MRSFARYLLLLLAVLAALTAAIPIRYGVPYPRQPGPAFDNAVRFQYDYTIEEGQTAFVVVGDSVVAHSIDPEALSASLGQPVYAIAVPGSTSAAWYLMLKNVILEAGARPSYLLIVFRDTILTLPNYHVDGGYAAQIDEFATAREDFLLERAYLNFMHPLERWALAYFSLYSSREQLTGTLDHYARNAVPGLLLGCQDACLERADATVYHVNNLRDEFRVGAIVTDEDILYTRQAMNFDAQVERSFLPEIIRLARENGIRLILVHERTLLFPSLQAEPQALQKYKQALSAYLKDNDVPLLDFSYDPRLPESFFEDPLHMNATGEAVFTQLLADALMEIMQAGQ
jgi:hypothetical protein